MKKVNLGLIMITILSELVYVILNFNNISFPKWLVILSLIPILIFVKIACKYLKVNAYLEFFYLLFIFLGLFLGSVVNLYSKVLYYDKVIHFLSGAVTSTVAVKILEKINLKGKFINFIFIIIFTLAVASLWEIFEYTSDCILKGDVQNVLTTGVKDTMTDMISAFVASLICGFTFLLKNVNKTLEI